MALRELLANAFDEGGGVGDRGETVVDVTGPAFEEAWANRRSWFQDKGDLIAPNIYQTASRGIFYHGFLVGRFDEMPELGIYIDHKLRLSEDRQLASSFEAPQALGTALLGADANEQTLQYFCTLNEPLQSKVVYWTSKISDFALDYASRPGAPLALVEKAEEKRQTGGVFRPYALSTVQQRQFEKALQLIQKLEPQARASHFNFTQSIRGARGIYLAKSDTIWIAQVAFSRGVLDLAATLYEEFVHQKYRIDDGRPMQEHLLMQLFTLVEAQQ
jgi:hypothetical protein